MEHFSDEKVDRNKKQRIELSFVAAMARVHECLNVPQPFTLAEKCREVVMALGWKDWWQDKS